MRYAVIGAGSMGSRRIRYLKHLAAGAVLTYDVRPDRRAEAQGLYDIGTVTSVAELVESKPDAVFICVPPAAHLFYLRLAVEQGWHFMTEQPISCSREWMGEIVGEVRRRGLITHVSCNMRFNAGIKLVRELIAGGSIGPVLTGIIEVGEWLPDWHPYEPYVDYYPARRAMGGGLDAVCDLEWLALMFGRVSRLACLAGKRSTLDIDTDDVVQLVLEYASGPQIVMHTDMLQRAYSHKAKFMGEQGMIVWDCGQHQVLRYLASNRAWETFPEQVPAGRWSGMKMKPGWEWVEPMYFEDSCCFLDRLKTQDHSTASLEEGIATMEVALQALECSAGDRKSVV